MAQYAISAEGSKALSDLAAALRQAERQSGQAAQALRHCFEQERENTGVFAQRLETLLQRIDSLTADGSDCVYQLAARLDSTAEQISLLLDESLSLFCGAAAAEPKQSSPHLPTDATGRFEGQRGSSAFVPGSAAALAVLRRYAADSVMYIGGQPDFSQFTSHNTPWGRKNCAVSIGHMTHTRSRSDAADLDPGNFQQADAAIARDMGIGPGEFKAWRENAEMTWHECADGHTMQLVPRALHCACPHSGGAAEMKYRMAFGSTDIPDE